MYFQYDSSTRRIARPRRPVVGPVAPVPARRHARRTRSLAHGRTGARAHWLYHARHCVAESYICMTFCPVRASPLPAANTDVRADTRHNHSERSVQAMGVCSCVVCASLPRCQQPRARALSATPPLPTPHTHGAWHTAGARARKTRHGTQPRFDLAPQHQTGQHTSSAEPVWRRGAAGAGACACGRRGSELRKTTLRGTCRWRLAPACRPCPAASCPACCDGRGVLQRPEPHP